MVNNKLVPNLPFEIRYNNNIYLEDNNIKTVKKTIKWVDDD